MTVRLEYAAGPGCPDVSDFKAVVIARIGYDPFVETAPERVLVHIEPRDRAMDGRIEWRDEKGKWAGEQTFPAVSTDCARLARAMGFALAVQIQLLAKAAAAPDATAEAASPAERPDAAPPQAAAPPPIAVAAPPPTLERGAVLAIGAGPAVGVGLSSGPVMLGRLFGVVAWPHLSLEVAGVASLPTTTRRSDGAGFSQQHLLASAAACATGARWAGCILANAGAVRMAGENIDLPTSATVPIVETGLRAGVSQRLGQRAFLRAHADGVVNVTRWRANLDQVPVWTAPRFAAALGLDAGVSFP